MEFSDLLYTVEDGVATITINRPDKYNAFRGQTCDELIQAFKQAGWDKSVGVIVLTGSGYDPVTQTAELKVCPVRIEPI